MSHPTHSCPITSQIEAINDGITGLTLRIRSLDDLLDDPNLPEEKRAAFETELAEIKKLVDTNKDILSKLHKENRKSYAVAACLIFFCFLVFGIYRLMTNTY